MSIITTNLSGQYSTSDKLAARARLNANYTIAETGWFEWVAAQLPLKSGDSVLDIGCGPGWFWASVTAEIPETLDLTLADQSQDIVDEALKRCAPLPFKALDGQQADAAALPFPDASFDAVIAMHMLYHLPDQANAIGEMARVLKPGGFLAVTTNGAQNMAELYALTTTLGSAPTDPAGTAFGFAAAERLLRAQFGAVTTTHYPARLRITDPDDVFLALTSYPPGDSASDTELTAFRTAIEEAFTKGNGVLETKKETGLFFSRKA